eukprot:6212811-Pleurochrysis_carterae.AAC.3
MIDLSIRASSEPVMRCPENDYGVIRLAMHTPYGCRLDMGRLYPTLHSKCAWISTGTWIWDMASAWLWKRHEKCSQGMHTWTHVDKASVCFIVMRRAFPSRLPGVGASSAHPHGGITLKRFLPSPLCCVAPPSDDLVICGDACAICPCCLTPHTDASSADHMRHNGTRDTLVEPTRKFVGAQWVLQVAFADLAVFNFRAWDPCPRHLIGHRHD